MPFSISSPRHSQGFHQAADLLRQAAVRTAFEIIDRRASQFTAEHVRICEIPAPPFQEQERGDYLESRFRELGLTDVHRDEVGNVIGIWPGKIDAPRLTVFSAHLDTVFPAGTDVRV